MLTKLMKYELKANSRLLIPLYIILLLMSLINRFSFSTQYHEGVIGFFSQFLIMTYASCIFATLAITVIYMIVRFYKNLLSDEGYLMFTLPVKTHQLITSKLIVTVFWIIISILAILFSALVAFGSPEVFASYLNTISTVVTELNSSIPGKGFLILLELPVIFLLALVVNILLIYVSIAFGQLFTKHKIIGSFAAYMIIYTAIQFVLAMIAIPSVLLMDKFSVSNYVLPSFILPAIIVILCIGSAVFYYGTHYMLKKKLNLD